MKTLFSPCLLVLFLASVPLASTAASIEESLDAFGAIGSEGEGNETAAMAWRDLVEAGPAILLPTLQAMDGASPLARNWMRAAVETVFAEAREAGEEIPLAELRSFLLHRSGDPEARWLAYDLYASIEPAEAESLVPGMIDDPAPPLRREAVALEIERAGELLSEKKTEDARVVLLDALDAAREVDQIETITKRLQEELDHPVDLPRQFGFLLYWHMAGPFDNSDRAGFDAVYPPEKSVDLDATHTGKDGREVGWREYSTSDDYGMVDFNQPYGPLKEVVGYAYTEFESDEERPAQLRLGSKNAWKVWFNGELLFGRDEYHRGMKIDQYVMPVTLREGANSILVKACQNEQERNWTVQWQFQLRVCDPTGAAILSTDRRPTPEPDSIRRRRPAP